MKRYRTFKKKHRLIHAVLLSVVLVMLWWGTWGLLDKYFFPDNRFVGYSAGIIIALSILYIDGFHLRDLE